MKTLLAFLLAAASLAPLELAAQSIPAPGEMSAEPSSSKPAQAPGDPLQKSSSSKGTRAVSADLQVSLDRLTRSNQELLALLSKQQAVLEDIQYDRRLQTRQIALLEQRLEDTLQTNADLQSKVSRLQAENVAAANAPTRTSTLALADAAKAEPVTAAKTPPPPPASYLPPEQTAGANGSMWWHRLLALSGDDSENSDKFHVTGKQWRVIWHNQDRPGAAYRNTSALFISAFPSGDTIPKRVCSQLGTGGDTTEMTGTGEFYLKIEASGGKWELAVEDFR